MGLEINVAATSGKSEPKKNICYALIPLCGWREIEDLGPGRVLRAEGR